MTTADVDQASLEQASRETIQKGSRSFAAAARRFENVSSFPERTTWSATAEYTPPRYPA